MKRLVILPILMVLLIAPTWSLAASDFGQPTPGRYVYDMAGVLTPAETRDLERRAANLTASGTPVIVYIRAQDASQSQTRRDAGNLMDDWNVQSAPDARDGLVIFVNLQPDNLRHGQAALYAGRHYAVERTLSDRVLQRIFDSDMQPALADGRIADGIAAGLDASAQAIAAGPPPPDPVDQALANLSRPLNIVAALLGVALAVWALATWRGRPKASFRESPTTVLPERLAPALAGALATQRVHDYQIEATILDLAARGALSIEPVGDKRVQLRLAQPSPVAGPTERAVWTSLEAEGGLEGIVPPKRIASVRSRWPAARKALTQELEARGWFDPKAGARSILLAVSGWVAGGLAMAVWIVVAVGMDIEFVDDWGTLVFAAVGGASLAAAAIIALVVGSIYPSTTPEGANAGVAWRGYRAGLRQARNMSELQFDLDEALPYAVAMGVMKRLDKHLKRASARGYAPAWFLRDADKAQRTAFYPYWTTLHTSWDSGTHGGGSGSVSAGGASGGGSF